MPADWILDGVVASEAGDICSPVVPSVGTAAILDSVALRACTSTGGTASETATAEFRHAGSRAPTRGSATAANTAAVQTRCRLEADDLRHAATTKPATAKIRKLLSAASARTPAARSNRIAIVTFPLPLPVRPVS